MNEKKNQFRNVIREDILTEEKPSEGKVYKKKEAKKKPDSVSFSQRLENATAFTREERFQKVFGLTCLLAASYLFLAFTSFIFTWEVDQDKVSGSFSGLFSPEVSVTNWLGKLGAMVSHSFISNGFGLASYLFVLAFLVTGVKVLFNISLLPIGKTLKYSFFGLIFFSVATGYIFTNSFFYIGGIFGYVVSNWLNAVLGFAGTGILLAFSLLTFLVVAFNMPFRKTKNQAEEREEKISEEKSFKGPEPLNTFKEEEGFELINKYKEPEEDPFLDIEIDKSITEKKNSVIDLSAENEVPFLVEKKEDDIILNPSEIEEEDPKLPFGEYDPTLELSSYQFPHLDLLEQYGNKEANVNTEELTANKNRILETLNNYNIQIDKIKATIGPTVTLYEIVPAAGVRISKIKNLEDDIALSLSALGIRIIAPIPGKGTIGIEVPNLNPETVSMRSILASEKFQNSGMELPIGLGKTISNETLIVDLAKMPHLLMAGATGQGKSVGLNAILVSLLYKKHPSQIKFVLVDPKKVELTLFNKIERHFLAKLPDSGEAIITDTKKVINTLNSLCIEMDQRYDLLKEAQVRNIKEYNAKFISRKLNPNNGHKFLPYIVLVVDEFADLIMTAGKEVEMPIARLAQLARAIGIHLIIATQRPSVNIITGTIKANFPARIAFRVTSKIDSRTILDSGGADQLIGRGDMLLSTGNDLIRVQCGFVDTPEVDKITEFIGSQRSYPDAFLLPEYIDESSEAASDYDSSDKDDFFDQAARIVVDHQQGSASLLQRRLKLGYNRAGRIIDQLEAAGIIGPFKGSKAREVLIKDPITLEQFLDNKEKTV